MTFDQFIESLNNENPLRNINQLLEALWWEKKGYWTKAHEITQEINTKEAALVHAYLHRQEGDLSNANYWYRTAGESPFKGTMDEEWDFLSKSLL
jgi:hypothetical protein